MNTRTNLRKTARNFGELNAPSPELMENTLRLMREAQQTEYKEPRRHSGWRKFRIAAGVMAAAMVLLVGTNLAFPAFAENLPFVGSVFQFINDRSRGSTENLQAAQDRISEYAVVVSPEESTVLTVPAGNLLERSITVQLKEVHYDGIFVFAGLEFQIGGNHERISTDTSDVIINDEQQIILQKYETLLAGPGNGFFDLSDHYLTNLHNGSYVMQRAFRVPDDMQGMDTLEVQLIFGSFYGDGGYPVNSTGFILPFTVQKNEVETKELSCEDMEMNGVRLITATSNPTVTYLCIEYPETYKDPACGAVFEDGIAIGCFGGYSCYTGEGTVRHMTAYAGLRENETRSIVWRLFDRNGSQKEEAFFVINFADGTVRLGGAEDVKEPPVGNYACGAEAIQNLQDGYIVEKYHADQSKPMLFLAKGSGRRENLWIEIWQDGELVDCDYLGPDFNGWDYDSLYWEYPDYERVPDTEHTCCMIILKNGYAGLDLLHPLTVRAYGAGELVLEEDITLEVNWN